MKSKKILTIIILLLSVMLFSGVMIAQETDRLEALEKTKTEREAKADSIGAFMFSLSERDEPLTEFDDRLWLTVIDTVTAHEDGRLVFNFKNGAEITA